MNKVFRMMYIICQQIQFSVADQGLYDKWCPVVRCPYRWICDAPVEKCACAIHLSRLSCHCALVRDRYPAFFMYLALSFVLTGTVSCALETYKGKCGEIAKPPDLSQNVSACLRYKKLSNVIVKIFFPLARYDLSENPPQSTSIFLIACTRLYNPLCPSVRWYVHPPVKLYFLVAC